jgi:hypothetical protein
MIAGLLSFHNLCSLTFVLDLQVVDDLKNVASMLSCFYTCPTETWLDTGIARACYNARE